MAYSDFTLIELKVQFGLTEPATFLRSIPAKTFPPTEQRD